MKFFRRIAAVAALIALIAPLSASAGVGDLLVAPTRIVLNGSRGAEIVLSNIGDDVATYRVSVELRRMQADGMLEPHQHPDSDDEPGPVEQRVFTFVQSFPISNDGAIPHQMELHATPTTISWAGPNQITAYDLATGTTSQVAPKSAWINAHVYPYLAFLGYDEVNDVWYSGNESALLPGDCRYGRSPGSARDER